jgi:hypothetical protein
MSSNGATTSRGDLQLTLMSPRRRAPLPVSRHRLDYLGLPDGLLIASFIVVRRSPEFELTMTVSLPTEVI